MGTKNAINANSAGLVRYDGAGTFTGVTVTQHDLLIGAASNGITSVAPSATSGIPIISQGASSDPAFGTAVVAGGGTGDTSFTAYAPVCGGTTTTGALQSASAGLGTSAYVLTSTGSSSLPTFQLPGFVFLANVPVSGGNIIIDISSYSVYYTLMFIAVGLFPSSNGDGLFMVASTNGGVSYLGAGNYQSGYSKNTYNSAVLTNANSTAQFSITGGIHAAGGGNGVHGTMYYFQSGSASSLIGQVLYDDTATNSFTNASVYGAGPPGADHLKFTATSGLATNGGVSVYGIRLS